MNVDQLDSEVLRVAFEANFGKLVSVGIIQMIHDPAWSFRRTREGAYHSLVVDIAWVTFQVGVSNGIALAECTEILGRVAE